MLIVRDPETKAAVLPPPNAVLLDHSDGPVPYAVTEMPDYGGLNWRRHVFPFDHGTVIVDRVEPLSAAAVPDFELQWNMLGDVKSSSHGASVEQDGVRLSVEHAGSVTSRWEESAIAIWRRLIKEGVYPHTRCMPSKCTQQPAFHNGQDRRDAFFFVSGFWIANETPQTVMTWHPGRRELQVANLQPFAPSRASHGWGTLSGRGTEIIITFN